MVRSAPASSRAAARALRKIRPAAIRKSGNPCHLTLDLEFKNDNGTNSGGVIHCTDTATWIPKSVEVQIADPFADKWTKADKTWHGGGIFGHLAPAKQIEKGEKGIEELSKKSPEQAAAIFRRRCGSG
jgi:predicted outer membrane repeat protein